MFKKIISLLFVMVLVIFSTLTAISCATTNLSEGYQNLYFKHAKIASFAARTAILNDSNESKESGHMSIAQKYMIDKYGQMKIDDTLGKDFVINQNKESKMNELFESTFGDSKYTYVKKPEPVENPTGVSEIISNDTSGYFAGTKSIDGISRLVETLLDVLTVGFSPTTLATVIDLAGESIGGTLGTLFELIEGDKGESTLEVIDDYIMDYVPTTEAKTIAEVKAELNSNEQTISNIVQYVKFTIKVGYNYFDKYLKNKSLSFEKYSNETKWVDGISDNKINISKLTNLFKYLTTTDVNLQVERRVATNITILPILTILTPMLLTSITPILGKLVHTLLADVSVTWKSEEAISLVDSVIEFAKKIFLYLNNKEDGKILSNAVKKELKVVVQQIIIFLNGTTVDTYDEFVLPILEEVVKLLPSSISGVVGSAIKTKDSLIGWLGVANSFLWGLVISGQITKAIKPLLDDIDLNSIYEMIIDATTAVFSYQPIKELITDEKFLNQVGPDGNELNSTMALLSIFKYLSIENIAKFLEDKFEPGKNDITFNLQNVKELVMRVAYSKVEIDSNPGINLSEFISKTEALTFENTIKVVYPKPNETAISYEYNNSNLPAKNARAYIALGLKSSRTSVHTGSVGEMAIELFGGESGPLLYSISMAIQSVLIEMPKQREEELDKKFFKPLYDNKLWSMDKLSDFTANLPIFEEGKETKFDYNLYRKLPNGKNKTYVITLVLDENNYWSIAKITK
ncbi:hypothetical protein [Spiroplasma endosymbiont of Othius punctulatus]|uniref:hypothetical protein n=1 Tax=Spiroplasma endosymbiont of Othius punctulatus TaxID=3066289 RepID=UPI0030D403EE